MAASKVVKMAKRYLHGTIASDNQFRTPKLILLDELILLYLENDLFLFSSALPALHWKVNTGSKACTRCLP